MIRRSVLTLLLPLGLTLAGCSSDRATGSSVPPAPPPAPSRTGELAILVTASSNPPGGFEVSVAGIGRWSVHPLQLLRLDLEPGTYTVDLAIPAESGAEQKCSVSEGKQRTVAVLAAATRTLVFSVLCPRVPATASALGTDRSALEEMGALSLPFGPKAC